MPRPLAPVPTPLPCPFCGSRSGFVECMEIDRHQYRCNDCCAFGPGIDVTVDDREGVAERRAIRAWNRRRKPKKAA